MKVTLWYKRDKQTDNYKYNHLDFSGHNPNRNPDGRDGKWLKDFAYLDNSKVKTVVYKEI